MERRERGREGGGGEREGEGETVKGELDKEKSKETQNNVEDRNLPKIEKASIQSQLLKRGGEGRGTRRVSVFCFSI